MRQSKYVVKWSKEFVTGHLKGIWYDSSLGFECLDSATRYVAFLHEHKEKPVEAFGGSDYLCHLARIVPGDS